MKIRCRIQNGNLQLKGEFTHQDGKQHLIFREIYGEDTFPVELIEQAIFELRAEALSKAHPVKNLSYDWDDKRKFTYDDT